MRKQLYLLLLSTILLTFSANTARASHAMGADISYTYAGLNGNGQTMYMVTINLYRDCSGINISNSIIVSVDAPNCGGAAALVTLNRLPTSGQEIGHLCPIAAALTECTVSPPTAAQYPGVQKHIYRGLVTLPSLCNNWRLRLDLNARNYSDNVVNPTSTNLVIEANINNTIDPSTGQLFANNSVQFGLDPTVFSFVNQPYVWNQGLINQDGDSIVYQLINPIGTNNVPMTYSNGYSLTSPITCSAQNPFVFNPQTGQITFTPVAQEVDVVTVKISEYRHGVFVGSVMRDVQMVFMTGNTSIPTISNVLNLQGGTPVDTVRVETCSNTPISFDIVAETDLPDSVHLAIIGQADTLWPGATLTHRLGPSTDTLNISWLPQFNDTGCYNFTLLAINTHCPLNGSFTKNFELCVANGVIVSASAASYCGTPVQLSVQGTGIANWSPAAGLDDSTSLYPFASPVQDTWYHLNGSCGADSVFIQALSPITLSVNADDTICMGEEVQLNTLLDSTYAPYTLTWTPSQTLNNSSIFNPVATPLQTTTYQLQVIATNGCVWSDDITIVVKPYSLNATATANPVFIYSGDTVSLGVDISFPYCQPSNLSCSGGSDTVQPAAGTVLLTTGATDYPTIYGANKQGARHQILYKASEIIQQGGASGLITALRFEIGQFVTAAAMQNFEIKMGCVSLSGLTSWQNNLSTVFLPKTVSPSAGWNTHVLDYPYAWDGVSDIVIEVCFFNSGSGSLNNKMRGGTTTFPSLLYTSGNSLQCNSSLFNQTSLRPNAQFVFCTGVNLMSVNWQPSSGLNAVSNPGITNPFATPVITQVYEVTVVDSNGCIATDQVMVSTDTCPLLEINPQQIEICRFNSVQLNVSIVEFNPLPASALSWQSTVPGSVPSGLTPLITPDTTGVYILSIDYGICHVTDTAIIIVNSNPEVHLLADTFLCYGEQTLLIAVPQNGTPPYNFSWVGIASVNDTLFNVDAGNYTAIIIDDRACVDTTGLVILEGAPIQINLVTTPEECVAANNGTINTTVTGGVSPYAYNWFPGNNTLPNYTGLNSGSYDLTVTDLNGCTADTSASITIQANFQLQLSAFNVPCDSVSGGSIISNISGGFPPYTYQWSPAVGTSGLLNGLLPGTYNLTVTDSLGCDALATANVGNSEVINFQVSATATDICRGTVIGLGVNAGNATFTWQPGNQQGNSITAQPLDTTLFIVTAVSADNCTSRDSLVINVTDCDTVGINEIIDNNSISILPNPAKNVVSILQKDRQDFTTLQVFNALGSLMYEKKEISFTETIDIANWQQGIYFVRLSGNGRLAVGKLLKLE